MKESSSIKHINAPIERVYATLSNLENLRPLLDKAQNDENMKAKMREEGHENALDSLQNVTLTADSIEIPAPMIGTLSMRIIDREENKCIKFETEKSPVKAKMWIQVLPVDSMTSKMKLTVDADVPFMLKPMIGSKLKDGVEQVASAIAMINY